MSAAQQLTLDGSDTRFRVVRCEQRRWTSPCYGARCTACDGWLTKWDFDEESAAACARQALDPSYQWAHNCKAARAAGDPE